MAIDASAATVEAAAERSNGGSRAGAFAGAAATVSALERRAGERTHESGADEKLPLARIAALPVQLDVRVPVPQFRISDLLELTPGRVVASAWPSTDDVPLTCGDVQLLWTEFEVVDQTLAVRVTRLI